MTVVHYVLNLNFCNVIGYFYIYFTRLFYYCKLRILYFSYNCIALFSKKISIRSIYCIHFFNISSFKKSVEKPYKLRSYRFLINKYAINPVSFSKTEYKIIFFNLSKIILYLYSLLATFLTPPFCMQGHNTYFKEYKDLS